MMVASFAVFLLICSFLVRDVRAQSVDACAFTVATVSRYNACLNTIPLTDDVRVYTIRALQSYLNQYVFLDINKNSPPPFSVQCDPMADLNTFATRTYVRDFDFHMDIRKSVFKCRDAHTRYELPQGYGQIQVIQPLILTSALDVNGNQAIYVRGDATKGLYDAYLNTAIGGAYLTWQVKTIDGVDALQYLINRAVASNFGKDPSVCFNNLLNSYMNLQEYYFDLPTNDTITYELVNPADGSITPLELYYLVNATSQPLSTATLMASNAAQAPSCSTQKRKRSQQNEVDLITVPVSLDASTTKILYQNGDYSVFVYNSYAVLRLASFYPSPSTPLALSTLDYGIKVALISALQDFKAKKLIIDVRGNGGGIITFGLSFLEYLFADWSADLNSLFAKWPIDIRKSQFYSEYASNLALNFADLNTWQQYNSSAWYIPTESYTRGGITSAYTQKILLARDSTTAYMNNLSKVYFNTTDIVVLTNGYCVSTCSFFMRSLKEKVQIIGIGGIKGQPMDSSMSIGAPVQTSVVDFLCADILHFNGSDLFSFPTSADLHWAFAETYDVRVNETIPAEFIRTDPDIRIDFWDERDQMGLYNAVIAVIDPPTRSLAYALIPTFMLILAPIVILIIT